MSRSLCASMLAITGFLVAGCQQRGPSIAGCEPDGTAPIALNRGAGEWQQARNQPQLTELWRSNSYDDAARLEFPAGVAASRSGRLAVADFELDRVSVLSEDGQSLGTWPKNHQLAKPVAVTWDEYEQLHIFDLGASALLVTDAEGTLLRTDPVSEKFLDAAMEGGGLAWAGIIAGRTVYFQPLAALSRDAEDPGESRWTIWSQRIGSDRLDTIAEAPARLFGYTMIAPMPIPTWPQLRAATGGSGILAVGGENSAYRIRLIGEDGSPVRIICRDADPLPLTAQERGEGEGAIVAELLRESDPPSSPAPYGHFFLVDDHLWVQRDRPFTPSDPYAAIHGNAGGRFDVFDPDGVYLGEIHAPDGVRLRTGTGDRVWGIEMREGVGTRIVAFQLTTP